MNWIGHLIVVLVKGLLPILIDYWKKARKVVPIGGDKKMKKELDDDIEDSMDNPTKP